MATNIQKISNSFQKLSWPHVFYIDPTTEHMQYYQVSMNYLASYIGVVAK